MVLTQDDRQWIEAQAQAAGFDVAGIASVPEPASPAAAATDRAFSEWIGKGSAGEMAWLERRNAAGELIRSDLRRSLPWARSVIVCAANYNVASPRSIDAHPEGAGWIARYAWSGRREAGTAMGEPVSEADPEQMIGSDYHDVLMDPLRSIEQSLHGRFGPRCGADEPLQTRCYVDTGPILERDYAQRAGVGWIGRNTCVLNQQLGSWLLLGVVVTSLAMEDEAMVAPAADRCGTCTRCIDACPTDALHGSGLDGAPRAMDASRCIAYLTIEKKGSVPEDLRADLGRQVFGCDICQDVCPWNRRAPVASTDWFPPRRELVNPQLGTLAALDGPAFNRLFRGSPLERTRRSRVHRNVALAMGNSGDPSYRSQLEHWAAGTDAVIAEAAVWALQRLCHSQGTVTMEAAPDRSSDDDVRHDAHIASDTD